MLPWNHDEVIAMLRDRKPRMHENVRNREDGYVRQEIQTV